ncbi:RluA family pseudouridine synthase [Komagataeibacter sp. FNDCF1]|uniref:RluA family pseudouridine synthase n=1 Tax=Komagataeibacter sp. FNDCF1 TaxID=2878681 RepID=UPI001E331DBC|nr:RluA family pseudouridine synthase [Komagataeibacter sp. FNDCF1]MCE2565419.1 RluA family pseudouridine synthase [Komagataeibacter sp. FNDCF1]
MTRPAPPRGSLPSSTPLPCAVLYRDSRFVVLDKPPGLPVHPSRAGGPSVEDWFPLLSRHRTGPWLVHRLDQDTAGCLVVALRKHALVAAQECFAAGRVRKTYWAIVHGVPAGPSGVVDAPLARVEQGRQWHMQVVAEGRGQPARTRWRTMATGRDGAGAPVSWLELVLETGRTHQARVHCAALGCPIVGDGRYGARDAGALHLMSRSIHLPLDVPVNAMAMPPAHMARLMAQAGWTLPPGNVEKEATRCLPTH